MNKRGISGIILNLIMIVLVLVSVVIVWGVIQNILNTNIEEISTEKFTLDTNIKSVSIDNSSNNVSVAIHRKSGEGELTGFKIVFTDGSNSEEITENIPLKELEKRVFTYTLSVLDVDNLVKVSLVPIFKTGSGKESYGMIDEYVVSGTSGSSGSGSCTNLDSDIDNYIDSECIGGDDCDDNNASINPGAAEICDGVDNNCRNGIDEGCGDTTPPVRSNGAPSGSLSSGTTSTTINLTTDETATCKYSTNSGTAYSAMINTFSTTGGTAHSQSITGLSDGNSYDYYVRCQNGSGNANTNDFTISFSVSSGSDTTPPVLSNGQPSGTLAAGITQTTLNLTTNEDATCKYSTNSGTTYSAMINTFSTTGGIAHSQSITGLSDGNSYDYYVRCQDGSGNANTNDYTISFSVSSISGSVLDFYSKDQEYSELYTGLSQLSGVTYVPELNQFVTIHNGGGRKLYVFDENFTYQYFVSSAMGADPEDISYLGFDGSQYEFIFVDERGYAHLGKVSSLSDITTDTFQKIIYNDENTLNTGGEGIAYDKNSDTFYICKEKNPMAIYSFQRPSVTGEVDVRPMVEPFDAQTILSPYMTDISSCYFDYRSNRLLVMSHESSKIVDVGLNGTVYGELLLSSAPQYEGLTFDDEYNLVLVSEPNWIQVYPYNGS